MYIANKQRGVSLIEALVAMLIFAFGLLGLAGVQMRAMAEAKTSNARGVAIRLIDDLNERMQVNRAGVRANAYALDWGATPEDQDCMEEPCDSAKQAQADLYQWKNHVISQLQNGDARVFQVPGDIRQIGVMIAWSVNEGKANADSAVSAEYTDVFKTNNTDADVSCPSKSICHLVYLQPWG